MSTSPDQVVRTLSSWLAGHVDVGRVEEVLAGASELGPESSALVDELRRELSRSEATRPKLEPLVRETIEAIALGH
jgi:hypothetical protein